MKTRFSLTCAVLSSLLIVSACSSSTGPNTQGTPKSTGGTPAPPVINVNPVITVNPVFSPNFQFNPSINIPVNVSNNVSVTNTNNLVVQSGSGAKAVKTEVLTYADTQQKLDQILQETGGQVIGGDKTTGLVQVQLPDGKDPFEVQKSLKSKNLLVYPNFVLEDKILPDDPAFQSDDSWGAKHIGLSEAWDIVSPDNIKMGAVEGGSEAHKDLKLTQIGANGSDQADHLSHGNMVSGIINAIGGNQIGLSGVMRGNADFRLYAYNHTAAGLAQAVRQAADDGVKVLTIGQGTAFLDVYKANNNFEDAKETLEQLAEVLAPAISYAKGKNVLIINAAGNESIDARYSFPQFLATKMDNVINVAGIRKDNTLASFSNFGPGVSVAAPAEGIYTTILSNNYKQFSGTSMAAAYVSGVAGLILSKYPTLPYLKVKEALTKSNTVKVSGHDFAVVHAKQAIDYIEGKVNSGSNLPFALPVSQPSQDPAVINPSPIQSSSPVPAVIGGSLSGIWKIQIDGYGAPGYLAICDDGSKLSAAEYSSGLDTGTPGQDWKPIDFSFYYSGSSSSGKSTLVFKSDSSTSTYELSTSGEKIDSGSYQFKYSGDEKAFVANVSGERISNKVEINDLLGEVIGTCQSK